MKAVVKVKRGKNNIEIHEVEKPLCQDNEVLINIKAIGVCGTDYHIYTDEYDTVPPLIIGHEFSGVIAEVGKNVKGFNVGERVISELSVQSCGVCRYCKTGNPQICLDKKAPGTHINGVYTEYINMPAALVHKISDNISFEEAAVIEPAAIVAHSLLQRTKIEPEDFVVVIGPGPIGLLAIQMAKIQGARKVAIVGTDIDKDSRLKIAEGLGCDYIINASAEDPADIIYELTEGLGADVVVECSGSTPGINSGINMLRKQGRMCVIGIPGPEKIHIEWKKAVIKALNIVCTFSSSPLSWNWVISMLDRKALNLDSIISHKEPLERYEYIFEEISKGNVIKAVLLP
ncbi:zinc-binding dehydrogenase [Sedimentibacter hydroxybenzoicus DSM 7310]|uniref:Zinc-binding dehydrogenase n=1 Tax=Sedimentibacter hydroxybenzoicus DSM 7310 TaxID=1123245 RepID=A0A974GUW4_SEDHY|nr:zinc-binding dehydrogenase [Sedimentibacter hydroxybenzoicus]NYB72756.1 zinc-binding dehydrogenase [Sedimentibacter hydroxybenzoicus DSM 7310]